MVTIAQARAQISDSPRVYPPASASPEVIGQGDGVTTVFYLAHPNIIAGSLSVFFGTVAAGASGEPPTTTWTGVALSDYTVGGTSTSETTGPTQSLITFTAAPTSGVMVAARYMATVLSDGDLNLIIGYNQTKYVNDQTTLKGISYDWLDILLGNPESLKLVRYGEYMQNGSMLSRSLVMQKNALFKDLEGGPVAGKVVPAMASANRQYTHYQPRR